MTTTLTNKHVKTFDDILKTYYNSFFKDITHKDILEELNNITASTPMNIDDIDGTTPVYTKDQLNKFIRNIINFDIKNFDNLKSLKRDTNMEFVGTNQDGTFAYNGKIKDVIIDKLNIINVFVDLLDAYKYCIDNENNGIVKSGYTDTVVIESIQIVADTTRIYNGSATYPSVSQAPNAGYIKKIKYTGADDTTAKTTLFLSIQSFNAKFFNNDNTPNNTLYNDLFTKIIGATELGGGSETTAVEVLVTTDILPPTSSIAAKDSNTDTIHTISNSVYQRQIFLRTDVDTTITDDSRKGLNKHIIKIFLKCLISIEPALRKQTVYALYYYYNFVQLYSTLIINICNVMYANVRNDNQLQPFCIETINTTYSEKYSRSISGVRISVPGSGYTDVAGVTKKFTFNTDHTSATNGRVNAVYEQLTKQPNVPTLTTLPNITNRGKGYTESLQYAVTVSPTGGSGAQITTIIVPVAKANNNNSQAENIDRFEAVYNNVITSITLLQNDIIRYGIDNNFRDKNIVIVDSTSTSANVVRVKKNLGNINNNKVIIIITNQQTIKLLDKLDNENDLVNNYYVYDNILKYNYLISDYYSSEITISGSIVSTREIILNAYFNNDDAISANNDIDDTKFYDIFKKKTGTALVDADFTADIHVLAVPDAGIFLSVNKKDLNQYRIDYNSNKIELSKLNEIIDMNERIVNNNKSLYDAQFNKNTFLNRQILIFNIIICIIVLILIIINVINIEKKHIKSISLACMGVILLLLVIYYISNITYIETFASNDKILKLKREYANTNPAAHGTTKKNTIDEIIGEINIKFISYFEKISVVLPSVDTTIFYKEIKDTTQSDIYKKNYIDNILKSKVSQSSNDMNALKYEVENNKLYILTLLISSIIFVGLYNIYVNYINDDKYVSLIIFISFLIFIIIISYYIINSNRNVRTTYKNIYWGPELSRDF
jgi:hypothetical protein